MRITEEVVTDVLRLLGDGQRSQRCVAQAVGISRATVAKIAAGKFRPCKPRDDRDAYDSWRPTGPIGRCATCGGRVYLPCQLCHVRALKQLDDDPRRSPIAPRPTTRGPARPWPTK